MSTDVFVQCACAAAKLEHLSENRYASHGRTLAGEQVERLAHCYRVRVVAVVDHGDAVRDPDHLPAVGRRPVRSLSWQFQNAAQQLSLQMYQQAQHVHEPAHQQAYDPGGHGE